MKYQPTENLRFVERQQPVGDGSTSRAIRVLQQGWAPSYGGQIEWRDVPLVVEDSKATGGAALIELAEALESERRPGEQHYINRAAAALRRLASD